MFIPAALAGFAAGAGLIIAIGAQNAFVLRQGLVRRHVGIVVAICVLADASLIACGVAGVGALVRAWPALLLALRVAGAAFLVAYGALAARRAWRGSPGLTPTTAAASDRRRVVLACLAFTFLNPHVYLDTMILLGGLSTRYPGAARWAFALGAGVCSALWFSALGYGARMLVPVFRDPRAWRVLDAVMAAFMLALAALLALRPLG
jgi:L-lysine exporter family protein LysE/ArgO